MVSTITAADVRALWTGEASQIGHATSEDVAALASQVDTDDDGNPSTEDLQVIADQLNGAGRTRDLSPGGSMRLYDADMTAIGTASAEQIAAAEDVDGGWIWIDPDGDPIPVEDEIRAEDGDRDFTPFIDGRFRHDLRKVCVA